MCIPFNMRHSFAKAMIFFGGDSLIIKVIIQLMWEESDTAAQGRREKGQGAHPNDITPSFHATWY